MRSALAPSAAGRGRRLTVGTLWVLGGMAVYQLLMYANVGLALRAVDLSVYGAVLFVVSLASLCQPLAVLGLGQGAMREVAEARAQADPERARDTLNRARALVAGAAAVAVVLAWPLHGLFPDDVAGRVSPRLFAGLFAGLVLFGALQAVGRGGLLGCQDAFGRSLSGFLVEPVLRAVLLLALLPRLPDARGLAVATAAPLAAAWLAGELLLARHRLGWARARRLPTRPGACATREGPSPTRLLLTSSAPLVATGLLDVALFQSSRLLVGGFAGAESMGLYSVAARVAFLVAAPLQALGQVLAPQVAERWSRGDAAGLARLHARLAPPTLLGLGALYALLVIHAGRILGWLGPEVATPEAERVVAILGAGLVGLALSGFDGVILRMTGRSRLEAARAGFGVAANLVLGVWWIPSHGVVGAAAACAVSVLGMGLLGGALLWRGLGGRVHPYHAAQGLALAGAVALGAGVHLLPDLDPLLASAGVATAAGAVGARLLQPTRQAAGRLSAEAS